MFGFLGILLLLILAAFPFVSLAEQTVPTVAQSREFVDQIVTLEGRVVSAQQEGRNTFLSLSSGKSPELTVALTPPLLLSDFPDQPATFYQGKTIRVKGRVFLFRARPEMLITAADRITVVGADTEVSESSALRDALRVRAHKIPPHKGAQDILEEPPTLPRKMVTGQDTLVLDLRGEDETRQQASPTSEACAEAQTLWKQVTQNFFRQSWKACLTRRCWVGKTNCLTMRSGKC